MGHDRHISGYTICHDITACLDERKYVLIVLIEFPIGSRSDPNVTYDLSPQFKTLVYVQMYMLWNIDHELMYSLVMEYDNDDSFMIEMEDDSNNKSN